MDLRTSLLGRLLGVPKAQKGTRAMQIQRTINGDSCELLVSGRVDGEGADQLDKALLAVRFNTNKDIEREIKKMYVNLHGATLLCSAGLGDLMKHWWSMKKSGGRLLVTRPSPEVSEVLKMAGLYDHLVEKI